MSIQQELERRVSKLDKRLQEILVLFLLRQLSMLFAKLLADRAINESFMDFMDWYRREYQTPENYNQEATRILKVLHEIREGFYAVLEKRGEEQQQTERALKLRTYLIAIGLIYNLHRESTIELAVTLKAPWIRWNNTIIPPWPCETCIELAGLYSPHEPIPERPHPSCKCWISIEY